jgi:prepilin-type N-terminal cleavage/methylation domain-containing protein
MKFSKAYTLLELICVMLIFSALTAVTLPVFRSAVTTAKVRTAVDRLRQLHVALSVYQSEVGGGGGSGSQAAAGLPGVDYVYGQWMGMGKEFFISPCGYKQEIEGNSAGISVAYTMYSAWTEDYYKKYRQNAVVFTDLHCNDRPREFYDYFAKKRGLAVLYGGKLVNLYKTGLPIDLYWFSGPPDD